MNRLANANKLGDVYHAEKAACCFFYDHYMEPHIIEEEEKRDESAEMLKCFLEEIDLTFDEFYAYIHLHSFGRGEEYLHDVNALNQPFEENMDDNYTDF